MRYAIVRDEPCKTFYRFHTSLDEAMIELERLCRKEKASFILLKVVGVMSIANPIPPVKWTEER